jgi:hypothetical protein
MSSLVLEYNQSQDHHACCISLYMTSHFAHKSFLGSLSTETFGMIPNAELSQLSRNICTAVTVLGAYSDDT